MSDAHENRGQGRPPSRPSGQPGGANGTRSSTQGDDTGSTSGPSRRPNTIPSLETQAEELIRALSTRGLQRRNVNDNTETEGVESMETDTKDFTPRRPSHLPTTRHENTPESNAHPQLQATAHGNGLAQNGARLDVPGAWVTTVSSPSGGSLTPEEQVLGTRNIRAPTTNGGANGGAHVDGNEDPNNDANDELDGDEDNEASSDRGSSPRPPASHRSQSPPGPDPPPPTGEGGSSGQARDAGNRNNSPPNQSSGPTSTSGSRANTQGQSRAGGNDLRNQRIRNASLPLKPSNWDNEAGAPALGVAGPSNVHPQRHQPSHIDPAFPAHTLLGQTPPRSQSVGSSSSMNPIASNFMPRLESVVTPQEFAVPQWQPDTEVTNCPICGVQFGMFLRKHHCRKCGRVVCNNCSPHRITIPHPYIVRAPGDMGPAPSRSYSGVGRGVDFSTVGGGERVRLCNPCVPDPNTAPPHAQRSSQPVIVDGRSSRARPPSNSLSNYSTGLRPHPVYSSSREYNLTSRSRSATTGTGQGQLYLPFSAYSSASSTYQHSSPHSTYYTPTTLFDRHESGSRLHYPPQLGHSGGTHSTWSSALVSGLNRPLPRTPTPEPEIPEEDACPVCHLELPSRDLSNYEVLREIHINNCITLHSNGGSQAVGSTGPGNHGTPPPRTTRRTRMFPYVATEKDCVNDTECTICFEEFKVGDEMARLECFCRFHRACIDSWFVSHPGRCPVHQHDSFGY